MSEYLIQNETLTATADKIRERLNNNHYSFKSNYINDLGAIRWLPAGQEIQIHYREFINCDEVTGYDTGGIVDFGDSLSDHINAYSYLPNPDGQLVPVFYKTVISNFPPDPDTESPFYYVGKAFGPDGKLYDKWRKIGDDDLTWDMAEDTPQIYWYTDVVVQVDYSNELINPALFPYSIGKIPEFAHYNTSKIEYDSSSKYLSITTNPELLGG